MQNQTVHDSFVLGNKFITMEMKVNIIRCWDTFIKTNKNSNIVKKKLHLECHIIEHVRVKSCFYVYNKV